jgi:hypothetical protein
MADQTVIMSLERAGGAGFSGAQPYSGRPVSKVKGGPRETARSEKPTASEKSAASEKSGDSVRLVRDAESGRSRVEILDRTTGEVLYQIPAEEVQKLAERLKDMTGSMVDTLA